MKMKYYILIALMLAVIFVGSWWILNQQNQQKPEIICGITDRLYCKKDSDCICADAETEYLGCFLGNKNYYEKCIEKNEICMDLCVGWGQPPVKCINNQCTNDY